MVLFGSCVTEDREFIDYTTPDSRWIALPQHPAVPFWQWRPRLWGTTVKRGNQGQLYKC
jgi:hypothetical protein